MHGAREKFLFLLVLVFAFVSAARAEVGGKITGVVKDQTGSVIAGAAVVVTNTQTGVKLSAATDQDGVFTFPVLSVGQYQIDVRSDGFKAYRKTGLVIDIDSALIVDVTLQVQEQDQSIMVTENAAQVETTDTQLGQVLGSKKVTEIPLNGRSYTDLFATQAGVTPLTTSGAGNSTSGGGFGTVPAAGATNTGQFSINGQREDANGFSINGASVQEGIGQQAGIIPNLDAIAEFRILTSNTDAEYGNYSGGLINVVTKSGGNAFHGSVFEFLRNTDLDAKSYFSTERSVFQQNQYGGTVGGPIKQNKVFFFADYQGQHTKQGQDTGVVAVPSVANRAGGFADSAGTLTGTVNGAFLAQTLSNQLGYAVSNGERFYTPGCTANTQCVFPNATIPQSAFAVPATRMLQYIPSPNMGQNSFESTSQALTIHDEKAAGRIDWNTDKSGNFSFYYFGDKYNLDNPYPSSFGGATVPNPNGGAFDATSAGLDQLFVIGNTKTFGSTLVNEGRFSATRLNNNLGVPKGGVGATLAQQGIAVGGQGIVQGAPKFAGVETLYFNSFATGTDPFFVAQVNNTFDASDTVSKVRGNHTLKAGLQYIWYKVKQNPDLVANGTFSFFGTGSQTTGNGFADFLLGLPDFYSQQSSPAFYESAANGGVFSQDSWRIRPNITINYGLRWDYITSWAEAHHQTTTFVQGIESATFPGAPLGYLVPGDPLPNGSRIPAAIAPSPLDNFSPRLGIAYSPSFSGGFLSKLTGGPGKTSIRAGAGRFFTSVEGLTVAYPTGNPPYGLTYTSPEAPVMATPFVGALTGTNFIQQFPVNVPPYNVSSTNPDRNVDWSRYTPISGAGSVFPYNKTPYTMSANLTIERQLGSNTLLSIGYIGSLSRHLLAVHDVNPGNPALCLGLSQAQNVMPGTATCGPFGENNVYTRADETVVNGTRSPYPNTIGTDAVYQNMGNANYNSLQASLKRTAGPLTLLASYTYGKSMDWASSIQEQVNPFDFRKEYAISAFDLKHNFVFSYNYEVPFDKLFHASNRLTQGWTISGVTRYATGLPVTFQSFGDNALAQVQNNGVNSVSIDLPNYNPSLGSLNINHDPRQNPLAFNTKLFSPNALGTFGNSSRRFFYGPGINNYDMALHKATRLTESTSLEFRFETFNTFNHAQFDGAGSVDGNRDDATFGQILKSQPGRISQVALKLQF
jgi:Carboxypeptidase regulatory-like domain